MGEFSGNADLKLAFPSISLSLTATQSLRSNNPENLEIVQIIQALLVLSRFSFIKSLIVNQAYNEIIRKRLQF